MVALQGFYKRTRSRGCFWAENIFKHKISDGGIHYQRYRVASLIVPGQQALGFKKNIKISMIIRVSLHCLYTFIDEDRILLEKIKTLLYDKCLHFGDSSPNCRWSLRVLFRLANEQHSRRPPLEYSTSRLSYINDTSWTV